MLCNYGLGASSPRAALGCNSRTASSIHLQYFFLPLRWGTGLVWVRCILLFKSSSINWGSFNSSSLTTLYFLLGWKSRNPKNSDLTAALPKPNHTFHNLPFNFVFSWILLVLAFSKRRIVYNCLRFCNFGYFAMMNLVISVGGNCWNDKASFNLTRNFAFTSTFVSKFMQRSCMFKFKLVVCLTYVGVISESWGIWMLLTPRLRG